MQAIADTTSARQFGSLVGLLPLTAVGGILLLGDRLGEPWHVMWALAFSIYAAAKWWTWWNCPVEADWRRHAAYLLLWPGMNAQRFLASGIDSRDIQTRHWLPAVVRVGLGTICLWGAPRLLVEVSPVAAAWSGMIGFALLLHFGLCDLLAACWQSQGIDANPLMNRPTRADSVSQFWGQRWNTAFRDLAKQAFFQSLALRGSPRLGMLAVFLFSGVVHDLVISGAAGAGYGLPTVYFLIQAAGMVVERSRLGRRLGLKHGLVGWLFTAMVVLLPAPLLFHTPFLNNVVLPMLQDWSAL